MAGDRGKVDEIIRRTFGEHEVQPDDRIWAIVRDIGMEIANREIAERMVAISAFVQVAKDFVEGLDLGPYDQVVSVAIKGPDGVIRVVQLGERE